MTTRWQPQPRSWRIISMAIVLVAMTMTTMPSVNGDRMKIGYIPCGTAASNYFQCKGYETCSGGACECPYNGVNRDGVMSMQIFDQKAQPDVNVSLGWSTYYWCEATPQQVQPILVPFYMWQGILINGSFMIACIVGLYRLHKARRCRPNLQTGAVCMLVLETFIYLIHYCTNPYKVDQDSWIAVFLPYLQAPITVSLYNVTQMFLGGLTSRQLHEAKRAQARSAIIVAISLAIMILILFICFLAEQIANYLLGWFFYLLASLIVSTIAGRRLTQSLGRVTPTTAQSSGTRYHVPADKHKTATTPTQAAQNITARALQRRIFYFVWGSVACSLCWLGTIGIAWAIYDQNVRWQIWTLMIFHWFENIWWILLLHTFWPSRATTQSNGSVNQRASMVGVPASPINGQPTTGTGTNGNTNGNTGSPLRKTVARVVSSTPASVTAAASAAVRVVAQARQLKSVSELTWLYRWDARTVLKHHIDGGAGATGDDMKPLSAVWIARLKGAANDTPVTVKCIFTSTTDAAPSHAMMLSQHEREWKWLSDTSHGGTIGHHLNLDHVLTSFIDTLPANLPDFPLGHRHHTPCLFVITPCYPITLRELIRARVATSSIRLPSPSLMIRHYSSGGVTTISATHGGNHTPHHGTGGTGTPGGGGMTTNPTSPITSGSPTRLLSAPGSPSMIRFKNPPPHPQPQPVTKTTTSSAPPSSAPSVAGMMILTESEVLHIASQLCSALLHLHQSYVVHRDLSLDNIFLQLPSIDDATMNWNDGGHNHTRISHVRVLRTRVILGNFGAALDCREAKYQQFKVPSMAQQFMTAGAWTPPEATATPTAASPSGATIDYSKYDAYGLGHLIWSLMCTNGAMYDTTNHQLLTEPMSHDYSRSLRAVVFGLLSYDPALRMSIQDADVALSAMINQSSMAVIPESVE